MLSPLTRPSHSRSRPFCICHSLCRNAFPSPQVARSSTAAERPVEGGQQRREEAAQLERACAVTVLCWTLQRHAEHNLGGAGTRSVARRASEATGSQTRKGEREGASPRCQAGAWDLGRKVAKLKVPSLSWELDGPHGQWAELTLPPPLCHRCHLIPRLNTQRAGVGPSGLRHSNTVAGGTIRHKRAPSNRSHRPGGRQHCKGKSRGHSHRA